MKSSATPSTSSSSVAGAASLQQQHAFQQQQPPIISFPELLNHSITSPFVYVFSHALSGGLAKFALSFYIQPSTTEAPLRLYHGYLKTTKNNNAESNCTSKFQLVQTSLTTYVLIVNRINKKKVKHELCLPVSYRSRTRSWFTEEASFHTVSQIFHFTASDCGALAALACTSVQIEWSLDHGTTTSSSSWVPMMQIELRGPRDVVLNTSRPCEEEEEEQDDNDNDDYDHDDDHHYEEEEKVQPVAADKKKYDKMIHLMANLGGKEHKDDASSFLKKK